MHEGQSHGQSFAMLAPSFRCPTPTGRGSERYDVFLSFRGSDTRKAFADHLYHGLVKAGTVPIFVFRDKDSIPIGKEFGSQILDSITWSKISIPIISENYASSKWCLRELVHMMDRKKSMSHTVLPIFYKVKPSDVRYLEGKFGEAFHSSKKRFDEKDIHEGQQALSDVSYLNGWESEKIADGHEGELVEIVIAIVLSKLQHDFQLDVPKNLIGIRDHVNTIRKWVDASASDVRMIGIYGMGGIGKTTLAKVIYNELSSEFKYHSFLSDVQETAHRNGIPHLQNLLIKEIEPTECQVSNVDEGINVIKSRLKGKKVLILLDDIDHMSQLNALAGEREWFMPRSMIIVTTRYKAILDQCEFKVDYKYELNGLDEMHSLLLFNRHAFHMDNSSRDFEDISRDIISTMGGLPLALEVIGSYLYEKTDQEVWHDVLEKLRKEPHADVQDKLKISYDALEDGHKEIFLDIACFFIGKDCKFAIYMWKDLGFYPSQGIEELKLRCLIKIGDRGELRMHDQLRDLGRNIVSQEGPLEKRSRLWVNKEASGVLMGKTGTKRIQAICLGEYHPKLGDVPADHLQTHTNEQFKNLQSLRFLQLRRAALSGDFDSVFSELRWLQWEPNLSFSTTNLHLPKLVVLQLSKSKITEHWTGWSLIMEAKRVKVLDLQFCEDLTCTPDLSAFRTLEILSLQFCKRLMQIHPSIGKVKSLVSLNLTDCQLLCELPEEVGELVELRELILDITRISKLPTSIGSLIKLEKLSAWCCSLIREIPSSIGDLQNLQHLIFDQSGLEMLPIAIGRLKKLRTLYLDRTKISYLPESIRNLSSLQELHLANCLELQSLPELPSSLTNLIASSQSPSLPQLSCLSHLEKFSLHCCPLEYIPELPSRLLKLCVSYCHKLTLPKLERFKYLEELVVWNCNSIERLDLSRLNRLKRLDAIGCDNLVEILCQDNFFLKVIVMYGCKSIEKLILPELHCLKELKARYCDNIVEIRGLDSAEFLEKLDVSHCGSIERLPDLSCFATLKEVNIHSCPNLLGVEDLERFTS
ncbi:disease resistance protein RUN1-like [Rhodamnia argentea]|uniref:Disease resistance protein RUN1-like n=1 Tax=Rhodamnia argentea TaxID=178133 RepID=A0ABM3HIF3_9MYRT|nr:disease resistance protein RUN1-like [Rhodamnia argentea]XP_048136381.1 disease resistance protein RUN1-like [Rhodamnia argentea]